MASGQYRGGSAEHGGRGGQPSPQGGIPDGLLVGLFALLLGLTGIIWSATGLSALFAHGAWPDGLTFLHTPLALRHLVEEPHNLAAAWPTTPKHQLSGYGLFWGILISELMVLIVLVVFAIGTLARYRLVRAKRRAALAEAAAEGMGTEWAPGPAGSPAALAAPAASAAGDRGRPAEAPEPPAYGTVTGPGRPGEEHIPAARPEATTPGAPGADGPVGPPAIAYETANGPVATERTEPSPQTLHGPGSPQGPAAAPQPLPALGADLAAGLFRPGGEPAGSRVLFGAERREAAAQAILEAVGPVLAVTSNPDLWAATKDARAKFGPTHVFDPSHLLDTPARLRWNPADGCGSREVAATRSAALLAPVRPAHAMDQPMAEAAETMLRCWLHAAAVDGRPFRHVHRWAQGSSAHEPVRILRTHPKAAGGTAGELEATLTAHPERRDMAQELTARALGALSSIHIRDACNPARPDALALESFIGEGGTLYLMGESIEDPRTQPSAMPLLTALASHVVEHGRRMAERSSSGRLDPPLTLVLDDVAAVAPLPALPDLLAQGAAQGLPTLALMRSQEQARARWPHRTLVG
ncbi:type IV secretory system conjugative DNA transfer family protein [Streptomyces sp. NPDC021212]|uniref:type IV secretory system conjugative DNA transfer family protein n=1 Tax=Streptomyces sp. NPDC021212 TaxID=3365118 RepID=UPI0037992068